MNATAVITPSPAAVREVSEMDHALFESVRPRLFGIAYRMLRSSADADEVVQDAWIRWQGTDRSRVRDPDAFLVTTTRRLAINVSQCARVRRETHTCPWHLEPVDTGADPALSAEQSEALELAALVLFERLSPSERAAYVLREAFDYPYRRISQVLALSEANARQLVTRARAHLVDGGRRQARPREARRFLEAFVDAAQTGELVPLERVLAAAVVGPCGRDGSPV